MLEIKLSVKRKKKKKSKQRFDVPGYSCKYFSISSIYDSTHLYHHVSLYQTFSYEEMLRLHLLQSYGKYLNIFKIKLGLKFAQILILLFLCVNIISQSCWRSREETPQSTLNINSESSSQSVRADICTTSSSDIMLLFHTVLELIVFKLPSLIVSCFFRSAALASAGVKYDRCVKLARRASVSTQVYKLCLLG